MKSLNRLALIVFLLAAACACRPASNACSPGDGECNQFSSLLLYIIADDSTKTIDCFLQSESVGSGLTTVDINPGASASNAQGFVCLKDQVLFQADDGTHGAELWRTDGTAAGTYMLVDINPGATGSTPANFIVLGDYVLFSADDGTNGSELWHTDGSASGTSLLHDVNPGAGAGSPGTLTAFNNTILFHANNGGGQELHSTDGTTLTNLTGADANYGGSGGAIVASGSRAYWDATHSTLNQELWSTDGTVGGTIFTFDVTTGAGSNFPSNFAAYNNILLFQGDDGASGAEIWTSDGTTTQALDFNTGAGSSTPLYFLDIGSKAILRGNNGGGAGLAETDGTVGGTAMITTTVIPADQFFAFNGSNYFNGNSGGDSELWRTDGTSAGTVQVAAINPSGSSGPNTFYVTDSLLVFRATDGTTGNEFYTMDRSENLTSFDIRTGATDSLPADFYGADGLIFFRAIDDTNGYELRIYKP